MHIMEVLEGEEREQEKIKKFIWRNDDENFPNLRKDMDIKTQEGQWTPIRINTQRPTHRQISN